MKIKHPCLFFIVGVILSSIITVSGVFINQPYNAAESIRQDLKSMGLKVEDGELHSLPYSVIVNSTTELAQYAQSKYITTIYYTAVGFVALNYVGDYAVYDPIPEQSWFGLPMYVAYVFFSLCVAVSLTPVTIKYMETLPA